MLVYKYKLKSLPVYMFAIVTDNGNYIVDLFFEKPIADVALAAKELKSTGRE